MIKLAALADDMVNSGASIHAGPIGDGGQGDRACLDLLFPPEVAGIHAAHGLDAIARSHASLRAWHLARTPIPAGIGKTVSPC